MGGGNIHSLVSSQFLYSHGSCHIATFGHAIIIFQKTVSQTSMLLPLVQKEVIVWLRIEQKRHHIVVVGHKIKLKRIRAEEGKLLRI